MGGSVSRKGSPYPFAKQIGQVTRDGRSGRAQRKFSALLYRRTKRGLSVTSGEFSPPFGFGAESFRVNAETRLETLERAKERLDAFRPLPPAVAEELRHRYEVRLTYHSTAMEGNTLTQSETQIVIEKDITIGGNRWPSIWR